MTNQFDKFLFHQKKAGRVLSQICSVSAVSHKYFYETLSTFLRNIEPHTAYAYSRKVPFKHIGPHDGYTSFRMAIVDSIDELIANNPWGEEGSKVTAQNWSEHGNDLLARMDKIHKEVFMLYFLANLKEIDDFPCE